MILVFPLFSHCLSQNKPLVTPGSRQDEVGEKHGEWSGCAVLDITRPAEDFYSQVERLWPVGWPTRSATRTPGQNRVVLATFRGLNTPLQFICFCLRFRFMSGSSATWMIHLYWTLASLWKSFFFLLECLFVWFSFSNPRHLLCSRVFLQIALPQTTKSCHFPSFSSHFTYSAWVISSPSLDLIILQVRWEGDNRRKLQIHPILHLFPEFYTHISSWLMGIFNTSDMGAQVDFIHSPEWNHSLSLTHLFFPFQWRTLLSTLSKPGTWVSASVLPSNSPHSSSCAFSLLNISWLYPCLSTTHLPASNLGHSSNFPRTIGLIWLRQVPA